MMRGIGIAMGLAALGLIGASPAPAAHHLVKVREVFTGTAAVPAAEFVELQLPAAGENLVAGQASVDLYNATGMQTSTASFLSNPPNGQSQRTMLAASTEASTMFGVTADLALPPGLEPGGGAACFDSTTFGPLDCVRWGSSSAPSPSPSGTPAASIPDGSSLTRSIAPGCATLLETSDDSNDSAADFAPTAPTPQSNSATPSETPCGAGGGGGAGGADTDPPNTKIKKGPKGKVERDTVKFKFKSTEAGSSFDCKLDRKKYKSCKSPRKLKNLDQGKHKFAVRATDAAGNTDDTPAKRKFRVVQG
jgi:hypothetical protein